MRAEDQQRAKRARLDEKHASKLRKRLQAGLDKLDQLGSAFVGHAVSRHGRVSLFRTPEAAAMQAQDPNLATAQARHPVSCQGFKPLKRLLYRPPGAAARQAQDPNLATAQARHPVFCHCSKPFSRSLFRMLVCRACASLMWWQGALALLCRGAGFA